MASRLADVPPEALALLDAAPTYAMTRGWLAATEAAALPANARPLYLACGGEAVFPMVVQSRRLRAMATPYTWEYRPATPAGSGLSPAAARAFGRACRDWPVMVMEAIDADWPGLPGLRDALREMGWFVSAFRNFGNWQEALAGRDWAAYLADRPGALREVLRRRGRGASVGTAFTLLRAPEEMDAGIAAYEHVYARSWKQPEPHPDFGPALLRIAAAEGVARLAVLRRDGVPVAAQYWVLHRGTATVLKLAHDEAEKRWSPGTLLTAWTIRRLLEEDGVRRLDFGRGDDAYKRSWAGERHQRIGLLAASPWHPAGLAAIARQSAGALRRRLGGRA